MTDSAGRSASPAIRTGVAMGQPMLTDFGVYECGICGKMVIGHGKKNHERGKHGGKNGEWKQR
jgi:hypothetical protein